MTDATGAPASAHLLEHCRSRSHLIFFIHIKKMLETAMDKRFALLTQIATLKSTHDEASALLGRLMVDAVRSANAQDAPPTLKGMRQYRKALKELKSQCLQAEMILAEMEIPQHMH